MDNINYPVKNIPLSNITLVENYSRSSITPESVQSLADDIRANGLDNPLTVNNKDGKYYLVAGHRRYHALKLLGVKDVGCTLRVNLTTQEMIDLNWSENHEREDPSPIDMGRTWLTLKESGHTIQEIAARSRVDEKKVHDAVHCWASIPKKYRDKIPQSFRGNSDGLITVEKASAIINQEKTFVLNNEQIETLFEICRIKGTGVTPSNMKDLAKIVKAHKNSMEEIDDIVSFFKKGKKVTLKRVAFVIRDKNMKKVMAKYRPLGIKNFDTLVQQAIKKNDFDMLEDVRSVLK